MNTDNKLSKQQLLQELASFIQAHTTQYSKLLHYRQEYKYLYDFIIENSRQLNNIKYSLSQRIHWVLNGLLDFPVCLQCGRKLDRSKDFKDIKHGYKKTCCQSCGNKHSSIQAKKTRFAKNNGKYFSTESLEKAKATFRKNWDGYDNNMKSPRGKKQYQQSLAEIYGEGITNIFQVQSVKQRIRQTKENRYGDKNYNNPDKISKTLLSRTPEQRQQTAEKHSSQTLIILVKLAQ